MSSDLFKKCYHQNVFTNHIYLTYMYKQDLALNNLQCFICHKNQPNQNNYSKYYYIFTTSSTSTQNNIEDI